MNQLGFLESLLINRHEADLSRYLTPAIGERAKDIVSRFRKLMTQYPAEELEELGQIPDEMWKTMKEIGLFGLTIGTKYGGAGLSLNEYLYVVKSMAESDLSIAIIPLAHLSIGLKGIQLYGTEEQKLTYLVPAAKGDMIFAYSLTEPLTGSDAQHITTMARLSDDGRHYILNGTKTYITNGGYAGGLTAFAQMDENSPGRLGAFIVETSWPGLKIGKDMAKMGLKLSSTTLISLKDVKVPVKNLLGEPGGGFKIAMNILNYGRLGLGAASAGVMEQACRDMTARAADRKQFGKPIGSYELIREKLLNAKAKSIITTALTEVTAFQLKDTPLRNIAIESSHTKLYGTNEAWKVLYDALQTAGGAGYLKNLPFEKRMRDFRVTTVFEGTTEIHSIYPPLVMAKELTDLIGSKKGLAAAMALAKLKFKTPDLKLECRLPISRKACRLAQKIFKKVRNHVLWGMVRYRKKISEKQYFLRRVTFLSIQGYALISLALVLDSKAQITEEDKFAMDYLLEESKLILKKNSGPHPSPDESLLISYGQKFFGE